MGQLTQWFTGLSLYGVALVIFGSMVLAALIGFGVHKLELRLTRGRQESEQSQESYLIGAILGVLALLMAFSFGMALDRYEERRHLVIQEANAIGTSYLRVQLLDEPHRARLSKLLVDYTDNRIELATTSPDNAASSLKRNDQLLTDIWAAVVAARESALRHNITTPLLMTLNEVVDLDAERKSSRTMRVPAPVLLLLYFYLVLVAAVLGYVLKEQRVRLCGAFFILLTIYASVIADLNRPTSGTIQESQEPMLMLQASLKSQPPASFERYRNEAAP
ncbi:MAG TPA: hypothetical protein VFR36_02340 [Sphingomicrobium sp.]|nr:hypothetical protein [Sphingomicrobium sp.]